MAAPSLEAGFALALADLSRMGHIADVEIRDALEGHNWSLDSLTAAGADDYDVDELRKALA